MDGSEALALVILLFTLAAWQVMQLYTHYNTYLLWLAWKHRAARPPRPRDPPRPFRVTIQLPVYNEETVVARLLEAVAAIAYPRDLLDVQLLDDSTDGTPDVAAPLVARLRDEGLDITHVRRVTRDGFKAGALRDALPDARGELVLILDADFVPPPGLVHELAAWFQDDDVGMVQARWGHLDAPRSLFARCSRYWIDRHFGIEQLARSRTGQFFHFNGSGGMWRRSAIDDAGGWQPDTLAEDLDLSFRAWRRRWRFIYDDDVVAPAELPATGRALRIQQARWARGAFQVARKALPQLASAPLLTRLRIGLHLSGYTFPILLLLLSLLSGPIAWAREAHPLLGFFAADLPILGFLIGLLAQFGYRFHRDGLRDAVLEIEAAAIGLGLAPLVFYNGVVGLRHAGGTFHRTPKSQAARGGVEPLFVFELALGLVAWTSAAVAWAQGAYGHVVLPVLAGTGLIVFAWRTAFPAGGDTTK